MPDGLQLDLELIIHEQLLRRVDNRLDVSLGIVVRFDLHQRLLLLQLLSLQQQLKNMPLILQIVLEGVLLRLSTSSLEEFAGGHLTWNHAW